MPEWLQILHQHVEAKGRRQVLAELDLSAGTLSDILRNKYKASTEHIAAKVLALYGGGGRIACPELGEIDVARCAVLYDRAQRVGFSAGNPRTKRLYKTCRSCPVRKGGK